MSLVQGIAGSRSNFFTADSRDNDWERVFDRAKLKGNGGIGGKEDPQAEPNGIAGRQYTADDLYGPGGPRPWDISQDAIGDCYFVATLAALADQQPELIQDMIRYDPESGNFIVTLRSDGLLGLPRQIVVTQEDIRDNIDRNGGSNVDNEGDGPIWPSVMEAARAKMLDGDWSDGLDQGYEELSGGKARDALDTLIGTDGADISRATLQWLGDKFAYALVDQALQDGRPVTLSTDPDPGDGDGLADNHVYQVEGIEMTPDGEVIVVLRNPWGHNGSESDSAIIRVSLDEIVQDGGFEYFNIGPAPAA